MPDQRVPAVDGWFTTASDDPRLIGLRCPDCGTYVFPPRAAACPNPGCAVIELDEVELSSTGSVWSWTTNHYPPPEPYVARDPFEPYTVVAVELPEERMVVLGQLSEQADAAELEVGTAVELVVEPLFAADDGTEHVVWKWQPTGGAR